MANDPATVTSIDSPQPVTDLSGSTILGPGLPAGVGVPAVLTDVADIQASDPGPGPQPDRSRAERRQNRPDRRRAKGNIGPSIIDGPDLNTVFRGMAVHQTPLESLSGQNEFVDLGITRQEPSSIQQDLNPVVQPPEIVNVASSTNPFDGIGESNVGNVNSGIVVGSTNPFDGIGESNVGNVNSGVVVGSTNPFDGIRESNVGNVNSGVVVGSTNPFDGVRESNVGNVNSRIVVGSTNPFDGIRESNVGNVNSGIVAGTTNPFDGIGESNVGNGNSGVEFTPGTSIFGSVPIDIPGIPTGSLEPIRVAIPTEPATPHIDHADVSGRGSVQTPEINLSTANVRLPEVNLPTANVLTPEVDLPTAPSSSRGLEAFSPSESHAGRPDINGPAHTDIHIDQPSVHGKSHNEPVLRIPEGMTVQEIHESGILDAIAHDAALRRRGSSPGSTEPRPPIELRPSIEPRPPIEPDPPVVAVAPVPTPDFAPGGPLAIGKTDASMPIDAVDRTVPFGGDVSHGFNPGFSPVEPILPIAPVLPSPGPSDYSGRPWRRGRNGRGRGRRGRRWRNRNRRRRNRRRRIRPANDLVDVSIGKPVDPEAIPVKKPIKIKPEHSHIEPKPEPEHSHIEPKPEPEHSHIEPKPEPEHSHIEPQPEPEHVEHVPPAPAKPVHEPPHRIFHGNLIPHNARIINTGGIVPRLLSGIPDHMLPGVTIMRSHGHQVHGGGGGLLGDVLRTAAQAGSGGVLNAPPNIGGLFQGHRHGNQVQISRSGPIASQSRQQPGVVVIRQQQKGNPLAAALGTTLVGMLGSMLG